MNYQPKLTDTFLKVDVPLQPASQPKDISKKQKYERVKLRRIKEPIDLEVNDLRKNRLETKEEQLARVLQTRCDQFLNWAENPLGMTLTELMWKNESLSKAINEFPQLQNDELIRLIDRDWRCMPPTHRHLIHAKYSSLPNEEEIQADLERAQLTYFQN